MCGESPKPSFNEQNNNLACHTKYIIFNSVDCFKHNGDKK